MGVLFVQKVSYNSMFIEDMVKATNINDSYDEILGKFISASFIEIWFGIPEMVVSVIQSS